MKNENNKPRFAGKGYYIALIACIAAVGLSGYGFVRTVRSSALETMAPVPAVTSQAKETPAAAPKEAPKVSPKAAPSAAPAEPTKTRETADAAKTAADPSEEAMDDAYEETMGALIPPSADTVLWPVAGEVRAAFHREDLAYSETMADWRTHDGLDIDAALGTPVCAAQAGTVTAVYEDDFLGSVVVVSHSGDLATLYANLTEEPVVAVGDRVLAGEALGQVGDTALLEAAEPPHLHFEVYENGAVVDPMTYLPAR